jgi:hypothetical protein
MGWMMIVIMKCFEFRVDEMHRRRNDKAFS